MRDTYRLQDIRHHIDKNDCLYGLKYDQNVFGTGGARKVRVDTAHLVGLVLLEELLENVLAGLVGVATVLVVGEATFQILGGDLLFEEIDLVEEENDVGALEPVRVDGLVKESERLVHAIDGFVFFEYEVVAII